MKICITTQFLQCIGGTESYLTNIIPALEQSGHEVLVMYSTDAVPGKETILRKSRIQEHLSHAQLGAEACVKRIRDWQPDLMYAHGLFDPGLESELRHIAPTVFFLHVYYGTCISGRKRFKRPSHEPCSHKFGPSCLLNYHLRGCGGGNPVTMLQKFFFERKRLQNLIGFEAVVTHSLHMFEECVKHGVKLDRLHRFDYLSEQNDYKEVEEVHWDIGKPVQLLFAGRLDEDKGAALAIEASCILSSKLKRPVELTIVGDGPNREELATLLAKRTTVGATGFSGRMLGWLPKLDVAEEIKKTDLTVFPSIWPEPFGLVGPESASHGKPVVAFDVGGIRNWLIDGITGVFASGSPPTATGLAYAMFECLRDESKYRRLCQNSRELYQRFNGTNHMRELIRVFEQTANLQPAVHG
jgi:glycosyltransferase involved in cell wall biosynthesis